jgi:hypothetical protein
MRAEVGQIGIACKQVTRGPYEYLVMSIIWIGLDGLASTFLFLSAATWCGPTINSTEPHGSVWRMFGIAATMSVGLVMWIKRRMMGCCGIFVQS